MSLFSLSLSLPSGGGGFRVTGRTVVKTREEREGKSCENWARGREEEEKSGVRSFRSFCGNVCVCGREENVGQLPRRNE